MHSSIKSAYSEEIRTILSLLVLVVDENLSPLFGTGPELSWGQNQILKRHWKKRKGCWPKTTTRTNIAIEGSAGMGPAWPFCLRKGLSCLYSPHCFCFEMQIWNILLFLKLFKGCQSQTRGNSYSSVWPKRSVWSGLCRCHPILIIGD